MACEQGVSMQDGTADPAPTITPDTKSSKRNVDHELRALQIEHADLKREYSNKRVKLDETDRKCRMLATCLAAAHERVEQVVTEQAVQSVLLQNERDAAAKSIDDSRPERLESKNTQLLATVNRLQAQVEKLREAWSTESAQLQSQLKEAQADRTKSDRTVETLKAQLEQLTAEHAIDNGKHKHALDEAKTSRDGQKLETRASSEGTPVATKHHATSFLAAPTSWVGLHQQLIYFRTLSEKLNEKFHNANVAHTRTLSMMRTDFDRQLNEKMLLDKKH